MSTVDYFNSSFPGYWKSRLYRFFFGARSWNYWIWDQMYQPHAAGNDQAFFIGFDNTRACRHFPNTLRKPLVNGYEFGPCGLREEWQTFWQYDPAGWNYIFNDHFHREGTEHAGICQERLGKRTVGT
jgi:hypothetical protein